MVVTFETFDPTPYQRAPLLTIEGTLALARSLVASRPADAPPHVVAAASSLEGQIEAVRAGLTRRRREGSPIDGSKDVAFDTAVDGMWGALRDRLQAWLAFDNPAVDEISATGSDAGALDEVRDRAERAAVLLGRLFGGDGLGFVKRPYAEQAVVMRSILQLVDEDGLGRDLAELAGAEMLAALRVCQAHYESMVEVRHTRMPQATVNLATLRSGLQRAIVRYATSVLACLDERDEASLPWVLAALRPIEQARRGSAAREREPTT